MASPKRSFTVLAVLLISRTAVVVSFDFFEFSAMILSPIFGILLEELLLSIRGSIGGTVFVCQGIFADLQIPPSSPQN